MKSGDPEPIDDLLQVMAAKQSAPSRTLDVVSKSTQWLKAALKGAGVTYSYSSCEEENHYGYAAISIVRKYRGQPACLDIKIAEIRDSAYIFAEVRSLGKFEGTMFPFFGDLHSDNERELLLHYIADFVISADA